MKISHQIFYLLLHNLKMTCSGVVRSLLRNFFYPSNNKNSAFNVKCCDWDISSIITDQLRQEIKYAILILNRPISQNQQFMKDLWNDATVRILVDGGTLRWNNFLSTLPENMLDSIKLPHLITGDFDSTTKEVLEEYQKKGCKIVPTLDQNHTDFTKALMELNLYCETIHTQMDYVIAISQASGRLDQVLGNIQTLFLNKEKCLLNPKTRLFLMSDDAISWLLWPGNHVINIPEVSKSHKKAWCSLVPVGAPCEDVTTTGLKWNLDRHPLKFGELVSTSNSFDGSDVVTVHCSNTLLWSMKVPSLSGP